MEVVIDIFHSLVVVSDNHIGKFPDNMYLLYALPVKLVQVLIVLLLIPKVIGRNPLYFKLVVQDHEPSLNAYYSCLGQKQQCLLNIFESCFVRIQARAHIEFLHHLGQGEINCGIFLIRGEVLQLRKLFLDEAANVHP